MSENNAEAYFPFPTLHILPGTKADFAIYLRQGQQFVLYTNRDESFGPEHRDQLEEQGIRQVYLLLSQKKAYLSYLRQHLGLLLNDESIPIEERAKAWCDTTREMARGIFENNLPQSTLRIRYKRLEHVVGESRQMFQNPKALKKISKFINKDNEDYSHGIGAMVYTGCVLQTYEPDDKLLSACCMGALLHDIGKSRLPHELFEVDPKRLRLGQQEKYHSHPAIGVQLSTGILLSAEGIHCILFHHERHDGKGFPSGAYGEEIPFYAKAVALANRYDNLIRGCVWRPAMQPYNALKTISGDKGAFESDLFRRLIQILADAKITDES